MLCDGTKSVALKTSTPFSLPEKKVARSEREISYSLEEDEEDEDADAVGKGASGTYEDELAFERYARQRFSNSTGHESTNGTGASTRPLGKQSTESLQQDVGSAGRPATRVDSIEEVRFKRDISRSLFKVLYCTIACLNTSYSVTIGFLSKASLFALFKQKRKSPS